ncbi:hypothetical protein [Streptomyces sp. NRRL F-2580]|uniref:hypothetical protein n=1 Tax=Streptomyces sp. NRRL F-2580 TaxID=1463841 RepID=UPI0004C54568|nr:hypothetical protein [Streptomyces sp. NRRL F-2580]
MSQATFGRQESLAGEDDAWDALQAAIDKLRPDAHPTLVPHLKSAGTSVRPPKGAPAPSV